MTKQAQGDELLARHEEGKSMSLDEVTKGMSPEDAAKFKAEHDKNKDRFKAAGWSVTLATRYVAFVGNKPFNVDVIRALTQEPSPTPWPDDDGVMHEGEAPITRVISTEYSGPLTYTQEKQGLVRETIVGLQIVKGTEWSSFAAAAAVGKRFGLKVEALKAKRKPETRNKRARFEGGVSSDPTKNMSPEDAAKWKAMNEEHGDKFKKAASEFKFRVWTGPTQVREVASRLNRAGIKAQDGTEHVIGTIQAEDANDAAEKVNAAVGFKLVEGRDIPSAFRRKASDLLAELDDIMAEGCPDNLDPAECQKWESNTEKYKDVVKDKHQASFSELDALEMDVLDGSFKTASQIGQTILDQMGGPRRLMAMLGVKQFIMRPDGVEFMWPNKQRSKGNDVRITLTPADTYTVEFFNVANYDKKLVRKYEDIYAEDLTELFYRQTGWALRLASCGDLDGDMASLEKFTSLGDDYLAVEDILTEQPEVEFSEPTSDEDFFAEAVDEELAYKMAAGPAAVPGEPNAQGAGWKLVTTSGPKRWLWDDNKGDTFFQVIETEGPGMPLYSLRVLDRSGFLGGQGAFRFRKALKTPAEAFARARMLYRAIEGLKAPTTMGGMLDLTQEWVTTQWSKLGGAVTWGDKEASYQEGEVTETGYETGSVIPDPAAVEDTEGSLVPDGEGNLLKRAWGETIEEGQTKQGAATPDGAKKEFERYKEKHPGTKKTPKDFLESGKGEGKGEDKGEDKAPKTVVPHKDLGGLLDGWHESGSDPIYEVASNARSGKPIPSESAQKALSKIKTMIDNAESYGLGAADKKQLSKAKGLLEKATKQAAAPSTVAGWLDWEPQGKQAGLDVWDTNAQGVSPAGKQLPKSNWGRLPREQRPFDWATPARGLNGEYPEPWRVTHADRALVWLKREFPQHSGSMGIYTDTEGAGQYQGREQIYVGIRDNRDGPAHAAKLEEVFETLKKGGWPVRPVKRQGQTRGIVLVDDLKRDALKG